MLRDLFTYSAGSCCANGRLIKLTWMSVEGKRLRILLHLWWAPLEKTKAPLQGESENKCTRRCCFRFIQLTLHTHILGCIDLTVAMEVTHTSQSFYFMVYEHDNKVTLYVLRSSGKQNFTLMRIELIASTVISELGTSCKLSMEIKGLAQSSVQRFMVPRGWIQMTTTPWLVLCPHDADMWHRMDRLEVGCTHLNLRLRNLRHEDLEPFSLPVTNIWIYDIPICLCVRCGPANVSVLSQ